MPRFLKYTVLALFLVAVMFLWLCGLKVISTILLLSIGMLVCDRLAAKKLSVSRTQFRANRIPKTIKTLVIGDVCNHRLFDPAHTAFVTSPGRSLEASAQILAHTSSVLSERGEVHIYNRWSMEGITLFDVSFLHPITQKELGCESLVRLSRHPFFHSPIKSVRLLFDFIGNRFFRYHVAQCPNSDIVELCNLHSYKLTYHSK